MRNRNFIRSLDGFKSEMLGRDKPCHVREYCLRLDDAGWKWFYGQMKEPVSIVKDLDCLFYILKWILKGDPQDFTFEVYFHDMLDAEGIGESTKKKWYPILHDRYKEEAEEFFFGGQEMPEEAEFFFFEEPKKPEEKMLLGEDLPF